MKKKAFLILAHNDPQQLSNLIECLPAESDIFIHLDKKSMIDKSNFDKKVYFIKDRINISWGGFSMVNAMMNLLKEASDKNTYSHYIFLSGNDYGIKDKKKINSFFDKNKNIELIRAYSITKSSCTHCHNKVNRIFFMDQILKNRKLDSIYRKIITKIMRIKNKKSLIVEGKKLEIFYGSQWFALTDSCVRYIIDYDNKHPEIAEYFKKTFAPDEMFFHTIIFNSPFAQSTIANGPENYSPIWNLNNFHYLNNYNLNCPSEERIVYKNKSKKDIIEDRNQGIVEILTIKDLDNILNSDHIFARKFDSKKSKELIDNLYHNNFRSFEDEIK